MTRLFAHTRMMLSAVLLSSVGWGGVVHAQIPDHLKCYSIKDSAASARYTADLTGLSVETGCTIKLRAKLLCVDATKTNVSPPPPGGGPVPADAGRFLCYKVKCTRATLPALAIEDQFGARTVQPKSAKMLCAPAIVSATTTTLLTTTTIVVPTTITVSTTTITVPTTTSTTTSTTSTTVATCANGGIACGDPCGTCGDGVCVGPEGSCSLDHCGSTAPVCVRPIPQGGGSITTCSADAGCSPGFACTAAAGSCGTGVSNGCNALCPE